MDIDQRCYHSFFRKGSSRGSVISGIRIYSESGVEGKPWLPFKSASAPIGAHSAGETPVTIPNTAVKPSCGYNTWVLALGK